MANYFREGLTRRIKTAAKRVLPNAVAEEVRRFRTYDGRERGLYLKIRTLSAIGMLNPKHSRPPRTARAFLFVCFGNIMRSPMCEALMNRALGVVRDRQIMVSSAGLHAVPGRAAHPWGIAAARELGISLEQHRARPLTAEMMNQADAIFAMDHQNQVQLWSRYPEARNKVFLLSAYAGEDYHSLEIRDPYYSGEEETRACYRILGTCIQNLVASLADH